MKLTVTMIIAIFWISLSSAQVSNKNSFGLQSSISNQTTTYAAITTPTQEVSYENSDYEIYDKKEWKKIQRQIKKSKKRATNNNKIVFNTKVLDTIFLTAPNNQTNSQITEGY